LIQNVGFAIVFKLQTMIVGCAMALKNLFFKKMDTQLCFPSHGFFKQSKRKPKVVKNWLKATIPTSRHTKLLLPPVFKEIKTI
jgi:hypothetical protein